MLSPNRSTVLGVPVVVVAQLARSPYRHSSRHGPALAYSRDLDIRLRGRRRRGRPRIAVETRQLIHEVARTNFLWGASRIHGELLKLGITSRRLPSHATCRSLTEASSRRHGALSCGTKLPRSSTIGFRMARLSGLGRALSGIMLQD